MGVLRRETDSCVNWHSVQCLRWRESGTMHVTVHYEAQLRLAAGLPAETLEVADQCSLLAVLHQIANVRGPILADRLLTADGQPQPGILLFVNEQPIPAAAAAARTMESNDVILLYPPISGG